MEGPAVEPIRDKSLQSTKDPDTEETNPALSPPSPAPLLSQPMGRHDMDISKGAALQQGQLWLHEPRVVG